MNNDIFVFFVSTLIPILLFILYSRIMLNMNRDSDIFVLLDFKKDTSIFSLLCEKLAVALWCLPFITLM